MRLFTLGLMALIYLLPMASLVRKTPPEQDSPSKQDSTPIHEQIDRPSVVACGGCHPDTYREWKDSLHHRAWTNDNVRNATRDFAIEKCRACHSPLPVLISGLDQPPLYRDFIQDDGVHCLSCHGRKDGVAAARTIPDAPCRPTFDPGLMKAEMCYPCHELTHDAFSEYYESDAHKLGIRCADCHMPARKDRPGHFHGGLGGLNEAFVKKAIETSCRLEERKVVVTIRNRTGHRFPGEIPSRAFIIRVEFDRGDARFVTLRKPAKSERREDDRLRPNETRELTFALPQGASRASVTFLWKPFPLLPDEEAFILCEWRSE